MDLDLIGEFKMSLLNELNENILQFWINNTVDLEHGGFYGCILNDLTQIENADKGCILNSRILWTYSTAYRVFKDKKYLEIASRAYNYMLEHFWDNEHSGLFWMVDFKGDLVDGKKQIYNLAFGIYGFSEYYRATGIKEGLSRAIELFNLIEQYSYDELNKGYIEALDREWNILSDMRLSPKDLNSKKSMNTHLHILEAYTNLLRVWDNNTLREKLEELVTVTIEKIIDNESYQFKLFFDKNWNSLNMSISYGHDIEGSWLLYEAAEICGNKELIVKVKEISIKMAKKVLQDGIDKESGGIYNERHADGIIDGRKAWWPQAEAMVGFMNAYELTNNKEYFEASKGIWDFVNKYFIDKEFGEWFNEIDFDGKSDSMMAKVDPWKCPYHNSRACLEVIERLNKYLTKI